MMYYKNKIFYGMNDKIFFSVHMKITLYKSKKKIENQRMSSEQEIQAFFFCAQCFLFVESPPPYLIFANRCTIP